MRVAANGVGIRFLNGNRQAQKPGHARDSGDYSFELATRIRFSIFEFSSLLFLDQELELGPLVSDVLWQDHLTEFALRRRYCLSLNSRQTARLRPESTPKTRRPHTSFKTFDLIYSLINSVSSRSLSCLCNHSPS